MNFRDVYHKAMEQCFREIEKMAEPLGGTIAASRENHLLNDGGTLYIVQLVSLQKIEEDNFGVVVDVQIRTEELEIRCNVDVLTSSGSFYSENTYVLAIGGQTNENELKESLNHIESLAKKVVDIFLRDYMS